MASTFHLGAYHELADTFTLGFEGGKKKRERERERKKSRILSFVLFFFAVNFLLPFFSFSSPCHLPAEGEM